MKSSLGMAALAAFAVGGAAQTVDTPLTNGLYEPYGIAVDVSTTNNYYYVTDSVHDRVVRYSPVTKETVDLTFPAAIGNPQGILLARGGLVIANTEFNRIDFIGFNRSVTNIAGDAVGGAPGLINATGGFARFNNPSGLALDAAGNIYIADSFNNQIRKLAPDDKVTTYAIGFDRPTGLAMDDSGRLYVADTGNNRIAVLDVGKGQTNAASLPFAFGGSGFADDLDHPRGLLWVSSTTGLLVADTGRHVIRRIYNPIPELPNYWQISVYAGAPGVLGKADGAVTDTARFFEPVGLAVDLNGAIVVADLKNNSIRRINRPATGLPVLTPPGGRFSNDVMVTVASVTTNAYFFYTTNGMDPTPVAGLISKKWDGALSFTNGGPIGLKVRAFSPDFGASQVISNNFSFFINPMTNSVPGGVYTNDVYLSFYSATTNASIHYTTNGWTPLTNHPVWIDGPFGVTRLFKAKAYRPGYEDSEVVALDFKFKCTDPVIWPPGPAGQNPVSNVPIKTHFESGTSNLVYYWTIDGATIPSRTSSNTVRADGKEFLMLTNGLLQILATKEGYEDSPIRSATFPLEVGDPQIDPNGASTNNFPWVTITNATEQADMYYTLDGSQPTNTPGKSLKYTGQFLLKTNTTVKVAAYYFGFKPSVTSARFNLKVEEPIILPPGINSNNEVPVTLFSETTNTVFYWATEGTPGPTNFLGRATNLVDNRVSFVLTNSGALKVIGYSEGFEKSAVSSAVFGLKVADPKVTPAGTNDNKVVTVKLSTETANAHFRWTLNDPVDPSETHGTLLDASSGEITVSEKGVLKVVGLRKGFVDSAIVSSPFNLKVEKPVIQVTPKDDVVVNEVAVLLSTTTPGATLYYSTDGNPPTATNRAVYLDKVFTLTNNAALKVVGVFKGFDDSDVAERTVRIKVDKPVMSPTTGYFPNGAEISFTVQRPDAQIYYTLDGITDPTTNSIPYRLGDKVKLNALTGPNKDLRAVRARAFAPNTEPSDVVTGQPLGESAIGIPLSVKAGIGSTVVVPVVLNLKTNDVLKSLQYRVLVAPRSTARNLTDELRPLATSKNDFVLTAGTSEGDTPTVFSTTSYSQSGGGVTTNIMEIVFLGPNAHFKAENFATVNLIAIPMPTNAAVGDTYSIWIDRPSGTSDGQQQNVPLNPLPPVTILVTNISYVVGDSSPGIWYNAGDFGDGKLNNADVNNAFNASLGVQVPFTFSDAFDAMDAFPEDTPAVVGGDGQIRFLDWQRVLRRALRPEATNYRRAWSTNGIRVGTTTVLAAAAALPGSSLDNTVRGQLWPDAVIGAENLGEVQPGQRVSVPVFVNVVNGGSLVGLQFRAMVQPANGAPRVDSLVQFQRGPNLPEPLQASGLPGNEVGVGWSPLLSPFAPPLAKRTVIGAVSFTVPASASAGQSYSVQFAHPDGVPDLNTQYDFAADGGLVAVGAPAPPPAVTPGVGRGFKLSWQAAAGARFVVESTADLSSKSWSVEADNLVGRGAALEFVDRRAPDRAKFYRVRVKP